MIERILKALELHEIKKSKVELDLGMPKNSLSAMLSGKKEIPKKWADVLIKYIEDLDKPIPPINEPYERAAYLKNISDTVQENEIPNVVATETVILAPVKENSYNVSKNEEKPLIGDANAKFDQLLKEFNKLIENAPKPKDIEVKLSSISEKAKNSNLTPRQVDAIADRCRYYLNGQYKVNQLS